MIEKKKYISPDIATIATDPTQPYCMSIHSGDDDPWTDEQWAREDNGDLWDDLEDEEEEDNEDFFL